LSSIGESWWISGQAEVSGQEPGVSGKNLDFPWAICEAGNAGFA